MITEEIFRTDGTIVTSDGTTITVRTVQNGLRAVPGAFGTPFAL